MTPLRAKMIRELELYRKSPSTIEAYVSAVVQGKGHKDRYTLLSDRLLEELRTYWREYRPQRWLFEGRQAGQPLPVASAQKIFDYAKARAGLRHGHGIHSLRHYAACRIVPTAI